MSTCPPCGAPPQAVENAVTQYEDEPSREDPGLEVHRRTGEDCTVVPGRRRRGNRGMPEQVIAHTPQILSAGRRRMLVTLSGILLVATGVDVVDSAVAQIPPAVAIAPQLTESNPWNGSDGNVVSSDVTAMFFEDVDLGWRLLL